MTKTGCKRSVLKSGSRYCLRENTFQEAQVLVNEVLEENKNDKEALTLRGRIALAAGDAAAAVADFGSRKLIRVNLALIFKSRSHAASLR